MKEAGFDNFVIENWYGLFVPAKTPAPLVSRLNQALNATLKSPEVRAKLSDMGSSDVSGTPEQLARFIDKEIPYWQSIVKRSGATVD